MARILIIDDDDRFRDMLKDMIERNGYEVVSASDGKEGIDLYRKEPTDLIITDIIMPNKEGMETIFELRKDFPDVKIIAISGGGKGKAEDYLSSAGLIPNVKRSFQKPFAMDEMLQAVKELVG
jgi:DNA-binding response OmpR family regulator